MELHFRVGTVFAQFLVYKRTDEDDICKDIKPEHQYDNGSKGTVDCGIFDRETDAPGEKSAYNGEKNGTYCRTGKYVYFEWASPRVAKINRIEHCGGKQIKDHKTEPVPKIGDIEKIYKIYHLEKRFQKIFKPSSGNNYHREKIDDHKESTGVYKTENESGGVVSAVTFKNFPKGIGEHAKSCSTGIDSRCDTDEEKTTGLGTGICQVIFDYRKNSGGNYI